MAPNAADGYASDDECPTRPLPDGYGALEGDPPKPGSSRKRRADVVQYSIQQGHGRRGSRREEAARCSAEAQPPRRTGAEIRPRLSMEYRKALLELVKKSKVTSMKSDLTILREHHRFLWDHDDKDSWELRLARRYYDRLFKEYVICDLTGYPKGQVGFRWRTQSEVLNGRGQFSCANKFCSSKDDLKSYEVDFKYSEAKCQKRALVKVRLCQDCAFKLHYRRLKKARKRGTHSTPKAPEPVTDEDVAAEEDATMASASQRETAQEQKEPGGPSTEDLKMLESLAWRQPDPEVRTREDDIDDYLRELFL